MSPNKCSGMRSPLQEENSVAHHEVKCQGKPIAGIYRRREEKRNTGNAARSTMKSEEQKLKDARRGPLAPFPNQKSEAAEPPKTPTSSCDSANTAVTKQTLKKPGKGKQAPRKKGQGKTQQNRKLTDFYPVRRSSRKSKAELQVESHRFRSSPCGAGWPAGQCGARVTELLVASWGESPCLWPRCSCRASRAHRIKLALPPWRGHLRLGVTVKVACPALVGRCAQNLGEQGRLLVLPEAHLVCCLEVSKVWLMVVTNGPGDRPAWVQISAPCLPGCVTSANDALPCFPVRQMGIKRPFLERAGVRSRCVN
nr:N-lysine methyltransferase KMT5A isoform X4 [Dasypus novemcinctus]